MTTETSGAPSQPTADERPKSGSRKPVIISALVVLCAALLLVYSFAIPGKGPNVVVLTGSTFPATVDSGVTVVDFWAEWCGPCRFQGPIMADLAKRHSGAITVGKVDVDSEEELADRFGVNSIPTIIIFKNGQEAARYVGVTEEAELSEAVRAIL